MIHMSDDRNVANIHNKQPIYARVSRSSSARWGVTIVVMNLKASLQKVANVDE